MQIFLIKENEDKSTTITRVFLNQFFKIEGSEFPYFVILYN